MPKISKVEIEGWAYLLSALRYIWIENKLDPPMFKIKRELQKYISFKKLSEVK